MIGGGGSKRLCRRCGGLVAPGSTRAALCWRCGQDDVRERARANRAALGLPERTGPLPRPRGTAGNEAEAERRLNSGQRGQRR